MENKKGFEDSLQRWRAFWRHSVADRPPLVIRTRQESATDQDRAQSTVRFGDTFPSVAGPGGLATTGWIFGAEVKTVAGIAWVEPFLEQIEDWHSIDFDAARERLQELLERHKTLVEENSGRYAVDLGVLEGPADMAVRIMGEEKLAMALYDNPETVEAFFSFLTELGKEFVTKKLEVIPEYGGGTLCNGYWIQGKGVGLQEDFGQMISPRQFREMILKHDMVIPRDLDNVWFHVHSGGLHMAREIADSGAFGCVQITNDYPAGPSAKEMLPTLQYIQKRCCLILRKLSLDQLDSIMGQLSPEGLAIDIQCYDSTTTKDIQTTLMTHEEAEKVIKWASG